MQRRNHFVDFLTGIFLLATSGVIAWLCILLMRAPAHEGFIYEYNMVILTTEVIVFPAIMGFAVWRIMDAMKRHIREDLQ